MWKPKAKAKSGFADRGKEPEQVVKDTLTAWEAGAPQRREFNRLLDTRAAQQVIRAAKADFDFYACDGHDPAFGLIEVKSTEHEYRLARDKVTQLPNLRKRAMAGGICFVLVYHSTLNVWRLVEAEYLANNGDKGSWNLSDFRTYATPLEAMHANYRLIF